MPHKFHLYLILFIYLLIKFSLWNSLFIAFLSVVAWIKLCQPCILIRSNFEFVYVSNQKGFIFSTPIQSWQFDGNHESPIFATCAIASHPRVDFKKLSVHNKAYRAQLLRCFLGQKSWAWEYGIIGQNYLNEKCSKFQLLIKLARSLSCKIKK